MNQNCCFIFDLQSSFCFEFESLLIFYLLHIKAFSLASGQYFLHDVRYTDQLCVIISCDS